MDDALTGHDEQERLMLIKQQLINILSTAGFELHKWTSNIAEAQDEEQETDNTKILGLRWNPRTDMFSFSNELDNVITATKRNVLSEVQKVFDPLGTLSPIIVHGKILMQDIWSEKLDWDEPLPASLAKQWTWFFTQISDLSQISFPRHVKTKGHVVELHGFSDAAKRAYGAVVFIRTVDEQGVQFKYTYSAPSLE